MKIKLTSVPVGDQEKALEFYTTQAVFDDTCGNLIQIYAVESDE